MNDQAPAHIVPPASPYSLIEAYGPLAMALRLRPQLTLFDGDRRRFGARSAGHAELKIVEKPK